MVVWAKCPVVNMIKTRTLAVIFVAVLFCLPSISARQPYVAGEVDADLDFADPSMRATANCRWDGAYTKAFVEGAMPWSSSTASSATSNNRGADHQNDGQKAWSHAYVTDAQGGTQARSDVGRMGSLNVGAGCSHYGAKPPAVSPPETSVDVLPDFEAFELGCMAMEGQEPLIFDGVLAYTQSGAWVLSGQMAGEEVVLPTGTLSSSVVSMLVGEIQRTNVTVNVAFEARTCFVEVYS